MQAKKRYILVFVSCAFLAYCYFGGYRLKVAPHRPRRAQHESAKDGGIQPYAHLPSFMGYEQRKPLTNESIAAAVAAAVSATAEVDSNPKRKSTTTTATAANAACRMETCFDFTKCYDKFLVYVYPPEPLNSLGAAPPTSANYQKILTAIQESRYHTSDPAAACLFVLGIDTLDRDSLSEDYVRNVPSRLARLPHWNNGRNHIIFNLYSGTWPDYAEHSLGFDAGEAILAKASMSVLQMRHGFDVSIPLFHKQFPLRAGATGSVQSNNFPANKKYLLAFKGKR